MIRNDMKEKLDALLEALPTDKAQLLLDFATFLKHQVSPGPMPSHGSEFTVWEQEIIAAEEYWFSLPEETRRAYVGKTVAVIESRILDADENRSTLRQRVRAQYPDQPVLYIEGEAQPMPSLIIRSPRFR